MEALLSHDPGQVTDPFDGALLTSRQAAEYLGLTKRFLERRRLVRQGPPFVRISKRCVRYRRSDLDEWIQKHVCVA